MKNFEKVREDKKKLPEYSYFIECLKQTVPDLPLFQMKNKNVLQIHNYLLYSGHCDAIKAGLEKCYEKKDQIFYGLSLKDNNLKDLDFSKILEGLDNVTYLRELEYINNELGMQSLTKLLPILKRPQPYCLRKLCLANCHMVSETVEELLGALLKQS